MSGNSLQDVVKNALIFLHVLDYSQDSSFFYIILFDVQQNGVEGFVQEVFGLEFMNCFLELLLEIHVLIDYRIWFILVGHTELQPTGFAAWSNVDGLKSRQNIRG